MSQRRSPDGTGSNGECVVILLSSQGTAAVEIHLRRTPNGREMPQGSVYAPHMPEVITLKGKVTLRGPTGIWRMETS